MHGDLRPMVACRLRAQISAAELAERAGISLTTLYHAERGLTDMRLENLWACADVLRVSLDEYIGRTVPHG